MDGEEIYKSWCFVDGDPAPFGVPVVLRVKIVHLKEEIKKIKALHVDASSLVLWQLNKPEPAEPEATLAQRIRLRGNRATFATRLAATQNVSTLFPQPLLEDHVHILVQLPSTQLSSEDGQLWGGFFKSMHDYNERRAILFASYSNPTSRISVDGIRMIIPYSHRVTLRHVDHEDDLPPAGLLFTRSEFSDLATKHYPFPSYRDLRVERATGQLYTWNSFLAEVSPRELLRKLENSASTFGKGLPSNAELQAPATAGIFSAVLRRNVVIDTDFRTDDEKSALQECFHNGWLHTDNLGDIDLPDGVGYLFPSSLHRWYVEWKLLDGLPPIQFQANSLLDFVIDVIRLFSPRLLSAERRMGPGCIQRLPEVQYQDELYRCCHTLSKGSVLTFPEFGTAKGRVDLYIPAKCWGIELLRDGNQLARHWGRFSQTGSYRTTLPLSEHIIVDCRTTHPKEEHPYMSNLYHAVFEDNFQNVCILENRLRLVSDGKFRLSSSS
ncbi:hypothetical protein JOM56_000784 [Amanita muscaria]